MKQERARRKKEVAPKFTKHEAKAYRAFGNFTKLKIVCENDVLEVQPTDAQTVELPKLSQIDPDDDRDIANVGKPFDNWSHEDKVRAYVLPFIGAKAQIHSLKDQTTFNGMLVTLEAYDEVGEVLEARLDKSQAMIKVGIEKLRICKDGEVGKDPRDNLMLLP